MSEEVNSVSFFFGLLLSRKANLSNSWRRVSLSSRSPPPPHFLRTNKLLLPHTLWQFPIFVIFTREARAQHLVFPHREKKKRQFELLPQSPCDLCHSQLKTVRTTKREEEEGGSRGGRITILARGRKRGGGWKYRAPLFPTFVCNSECFLFPATSQLAT